VVLATQVWNGNGWARDLLEDVMRHDSHKNLSGLDFRGFNRVQTSETLLNITALRLMLNRLAPA